MRCHLCPRDETKIRKKAKVASMRLGLPPPSPASCKGTEFSDLPAFLPLPVPSTVISDTDSQGGSTACTGLTQELASGPSSEDDASVGSEADTLAPSREIAETKADPDLDGDVACSERAGAASGPASIIQRRDRRALTEPVHLRWTNGVITTDKSHVEDGKITGPLASPPGLQPLDGASNIGSAFHGTGECRPCAWFWKLEGCQNGQDCRHCHICPEGEIKTRRKARLASLRLSSALP
jgi:hypothetical protein